MLIIPATSVYLQSSWWLFQHPLSISNIMLITPPPSVYVQSSSWLFQHSLCMSSHHADYSSTLCVCPVIMLIIPAHPVYVQSSSWLFQHTLSMSSRHADYSHHTQTLLVSHYVRRHVFSVSGSASLNNPLPKVFTYYENFAGSEGVIWHSARREERGCKLSLWGSEPIRVLFY